MRGLQGLWVHKVQLRGYLQETLDIGRIKAFGLCSIAVMLLLLHSCAPRPTVYPPPEARFITASWYGSEFHGRPTASGEIFDMHAMTAAHREFPFGTRLRITNPDNNKSVVVTVNDRGPFVDGRDIDLSYGAAERIGLVRKGVSNVFMEYLGRDMSYVKEVSFVSSSKGTLTIQVGSFIEKTNAERLKRALELSHDNVYITTAHIGGKMFYRVRIGEFKDRSDAYSFAKKLAFEGYSTLITTKY